MANSSIILHLQPFSMKSKRTNVGQKCQTWLEEFEDELHLQRVTDDNDKIICLKRYGGIEIRLIVKYFPSTEQNRNETYCNDTVLAPTHVNFLLTISFMAGDQLVAERGNAHFFTATRIRSGGHEKIKQTNKQEQCLGLTQSRRRVCNTTFMCGLTLAWVTSENSTKQLACRHLLTRSSSLDPIFSAGLTAPVYGVDCPCPWFHASTLCWLASLLSRRQLPLRSFSNQLSLASPYHFRIPRDFRSKNPLSGFAPKQTKESSAWRATHIVLDYEEVERKLNHQFIIHNTCKIITMTQ